MRDDHNSHNFGIVFAFVGLWLAVALAAGVRVERVEDGSGIVGLYNWGSVTYCIPLAPCW